MSKIICPCIECTHNNGNCMCDAGKIVLEHGKRETLNNGRVDMWTCKEYKLSADYKAILDEVKGLTEEEVEHYSKLAEHYDGKEK